MTAKILVVEDSPMIQDMVRSTLEAANYEVVCANHGVEGLALLKQHKVDLIISDLNMIHMGGIEFLTRIRGEPEHEFTPFLFLTTEDAEELKAIGREEGATGWLLKPFDPPALVSVVRRIIH